MTVTLTNTWGGRRAQIAERDLGEVAEAGYEADLARARLTDLPPPPFSPSRAYGDEEGRQAMARLVEAACRCRGSESPRVRIGPNSPVS
ncbi:hypothetical protein [Streptomyces botrytidirepellens]|uniref:hypothetical protein n=1 Tax=Streptomyces botrytidirepellens TaxID=2486417 RepID=UPI0011CD9711|nr:hypothetical protein [Streptomyces botrytidirepellens]